MIKFGSKVKIIDKPFYVDVVGTVLDYSQGSDQFTVVLEHNVHKDFFGHSLKLVSTKKTPAKGGKK